MVRTADGLSECWTATAAGETRGSGQIAIGIECPLHPGWSAGRLVGWLASRLADWLVWKMKKERVRSARSARQRNVIIYFFAPLFLFFSFSLSFCTTPPRCSSSLILLLRAGCAGLDDLVIVFFFYCVFALLCFLGCSQGFFLLSPANINLPL